MFNDNATGTYINEKKSPTAVSSSVGFLVLIASVMTNCSSYRTLNLNSYIEAKTRSRSSQKFDGSIILLSNNTANELPYQAPKYFKFADEVNYQSPETLDWIAESYKKLIALSDLSANWDSYGAESPNDTALNWTKEVLRILFHLDFPPTKITPSVENGVGISFICNNKYADIECFNEGDILAITSDGQGNPEVWEVEATTLGITSTIEKIRVFLQR
jgi:hypothetical protein